MLWPRPGVLWPRPVVTPPPRNDEWNSERPKEESKGYDGPAGMEPDGMIDSNWDEVSRLLVLVVVLLLVLLLVEEV